MGRCTVTLLLALSALSATSAFHTLVPDGKELVYDYKALIQAGAEVPASYASEFYLHGKLHVQKEATSTVVQLADLKYMVYNGHRYHGHEYELHEHPVPQEAEDLLKPFKVVYNSNGQAKSIATEQEEKMYARNMHKAIAAMLQLDVEKVNLDSKKAHAFMTEEHSLYGKTMAAYNVLPKGEKLIVQKMHDMKSTKPMYYAMITNIEPDYCEAHYEEPMAHDSHQYYKIVKKDGHHIVKHLENTGGIYIYPFQAKSEGHYVHVNVTLNLDDIVPVQKAFKVASEHVEENLMFDVADPSVETSLPDILNGRRTVDMQKHMPVIETMMADFLEFLHKNPIHAQHPDVEHAQLVNRMVRLLTIFDYTHLEQMYNTMSAKTSDEGKKHVEIFYQLLPLVGTHASVMLVKKIVHEKKVDDHVAMQMLHNVPFYVRVPNEKMLHDAEDMLTWGNDINVHVRHAAVLSFATLIHKTYETQKRFAQGHQHHHHHHHDHDMMTHDHEHINLRVNGLHHYSYLSQQEEKFVNEHKIYDKYVTDFANKMKSAQDKPTQALYMQAMFNTKLHSVVEHLVPIVKGEQMDHHALRHTAMWAIAPMVVGNHDLVYELYWPIFSDWSQDLELRILAYYIIMESHPPISRLLNMYWELQSEPSSELYHFHYDYLWAMAHTTDPCHQVFRLNAYQLLTYTRKPNQQALSSYYQIDYTDKEYKFGGDFSYLTVSGKTSKVHHFEINSQMFNVRSNYFSLYIRVDGLTETAHKKLHLNLDSTTQLFNYDEVWNLIKSVSDNKDVHVTISFGHNHQIVQTCFFDHSNLKELGTLFAFFHDTQFNEVKNSIEIHYDMFTQILFPTEMGIPAFMEIIIPTVHHKHINMQKNTENNLITFHIDNRHHIARYGRYGLSFYNPIADIWQGINRFHTYDFVVPIYGDITINTQQHSVKLTMKKHHDEFKDIAGMRSHVTSLVFVKDDLHHGSLKKSCEKCQSWVVVTKGDEYRHNTTMHFNLGFSKHNYEAALYDNEMYTSFAKFRHFLMRMFSRHGKNYWTPLGYSILFFRNWHMINMLQPTPGTHGIMIGDLPHEDNPVSEIDLTFRINKELTQAKDQFLPGLKYNSRITYTVKSKEKTLKTWDANSLIEVNPGHTVRDIKVDLTRIIPGQKDFKVCMDFNRKWNKEGVTGHSTIHMGQSADGKCNRDDASIEITTKGEYSDHQKLPHHVYEICEPYEHHLGADYHSMYCTAAHTSIRKYTYDIKTHNVPTEYKNMFASAYKKFRLGFNEYYEDEEVESQVPENEVKVVVEYPTFAHEMNVKVMTHHHHLKFFGIPTRMGWLGLENTHYSRLYMFMHYIGMMHTCTVHQHEVQHGLYDNKHVEAFEVPNEWTMFVGDVEKNAQHGVFLKKVEGTHLIALKVVHGSHSLEIHPVGKHGEHHNLIVDGKEVPYTKDSMDYQSEDWYSILYRSRTHTVALTTFHFQLHMEYTGDKIIIEVPKVQGVQFYGHCLKH